jgi:hypothetical protein
MAEARRTPGGAVGDRGRIRNARALHTRDALRQELTRPCPSVGGRGAHTATTTTREGCRSYRRAQLGHTTRLVRPHGYEEHIKNYLEAHLATSSVVTSESATSHAHAEITALPEQSPLDKKAQVSR